jgi:head-tail adaptor
MNPSDLNKLIYIEQGIAGTTTSASPKLNWTQYCRTYANVYTPAGDARLTYGTGEEFVYTTIFKIRYNSRTSILTNKYRVKYNDIYYKIVKVEEIGIKEGMALTCTFYFYD